MLSSAHYGGVLGLLGIGGAVLAEHTDGRKTTISHLVRAEVVDVGLGYLGEVGLGVIRLHKGVGLALEITPQIVLRVVEARGYRLELELASGLPVMLAAHGSQTTLRL